MSVTCIIRTSKSFCANHFLVGAVIALAPVFGAANIVVGRIYIGFDDSCIHIRRTTYARQPFPNPFRRMLGLRCLLPATCD